MSPRRISQGGFFEGPGSPAATSNSKHSGGPSSPGWQAPLPSQCNVELVQPVALLYWPHAHIYSLLQCKGKSAFVTFVQPCPATIALSHGKDVSKSEVKIRLQNRGLLADIQARRFIAKTLWQPGDK
ncbi:hypothetical protein AJ78_02622 [Emergomyces pasteurianus Ep9510]|uniref:Uncharacterized protein n=1 Tax=Emergomyces pasteurianus Ep9510 TaxID=1447872 RepID=A0A1J9PLA0_9EURO|nr:hypothetical protein AJ78_02622 [Emergomyces pasteurianus Ep9510]